MRYIIHAVNWPYVAEMAIKALGAAAVLLLPWVASYLWLIGAI